MKLSFLSLIALVTCLFFQSTLSMAQPGYAQGAASSEKMTDNEGIVVDFMDAAGYTYMELQNSGHKFWIAAPTTQVNKGDHIRFSQSMVMTNFTSKTLNRTFGTIIFVSSTEVKK
ncbi:hypothetical protein [Nitrosomonas sp.]|uniref:hypothetical protein n=1 Tax=Nitrosomonas sp. TaxID=42353 RepID=UPI001D9484C6|nr:hypothetical protein [Nitrosomonas sp.]MBX3617772.1 hypothetical protein [Nitrosomonas sp.]